MHPESPPRPRTGPPALFLRGFFGPRGKGMAKAGPSRERWERWGWSGGAPPQPDLLILESLSMASLRLCSSTPTPHRPSSSLPGRPGSQSPESAVVPTADPHRSIPGLTCCSVSGDAEGDSVNSREEAAGGRVGGRDLEKVGPSDPSQVNPQQGHLALLHGKPPPDSAQDPRSSGCSGPSSVTALLLWDGPHALSDEWHLQIGGEGHVLPRGWTPGPGWWSGANSTPSYINPCGEPPGRHEGVGDPVTVCGGVLRSPSLPHITEPSPWSWLGSPSLPSAPCTALRPLLSQAK